MKIVVKAGTVAEIEIRDWRVVRAEGDLARPYRALVEIVLGEVREMSDYRRRGLLVSQLERLGMDIVAEEWPPFGEVPPGAIP